MPTGLGSGASKKRGGGSPANATAEISSGQSREGLHRSLMSVREAAPSPPLRPFALRQTPMLNVETHPLRSTEGRQIRNSQSMIDRWVCNVSSFALPVLLAAEQPSEKLPAHYVASRSSCSAGFQPYLELCLVVSVIKTKQPEHLVRLTPANHSNQ